MKRRNQMIDIYHDPFEHPEMHHELPLDYMKYTGAPYLGALQSKLKVHTEDNRRHITEEERDTWNRKADKVSLYDLETRIAQKADKKEIPTLLSELKNDVPYLTADVLDSRLADLNFITDSTLRYKLEGYVKTDQLTPYATKDFVTSQGYIKNVDLSDYAKKSDLILDGYIKTGDLLGTINGKRFYQGGSVTIETGGGGGEGGDVIIQGLTKDDINYTPAINVSTPNSYLIGSLRITGKDPIAIYGKDLYGSSDGGSDSGQDKSIAELYERLGRLDNQIQSLTNDLNNIYGKSEADIQRTVTTLIEDFNYIKKHWDLDKIFSDAGWNSKMNAYMSTVGLLTKDQNDNYTAAWTQLQQKYNAIEATVNAMKEWADPKGTSFEAFQAALEAYVDEKVGQATASISTKWAISNGEEVLRWMASGFSSQAGRTDPETGEEYESFAEMYADGFDGVNKAVAAVHTEVETLDGKIVDAKAELGAQIDNKTAGVVTQATLDESVASLFAADKDSGSRAAVLATVQNDKTTLDMIADNVTISGGKVAESIENQDIQLDGKLKATNVDIYGNVTATKLIAKEGNVGIYTSPNGIEFKSGTEPSGADKGSAYFELKDGQFEFAIWVAALGEYRKIDLTKLISVTDVQTYRFFSDTQMIASTQDGSMVQDGDILLYSKNGRFYTNSQCTNLANGRYYTMLRAMGDNDMNGFIVNVGETEDMYAMAGAQRRIFVGHDIVNGVYDNSNSYYVYVARQLSISSGGTVTRGAYKFVNGTERENVSVTSMLFPDNTNDKTKTFDPFTMDIVSLSNTKKEYTEANKIKLYSFEEEDPEIWAEGYMA